MKRGTKNLTVSPSFSHEMWHNCFVILRATGRKHPEMKINIPKTEAGTNCERGSLSSIFLNVTIIFFIRLAGVPAWWLGLHGADSRRGRPSKSPGERRKEPAASEHHQPSPLFLKVGPFP